MRYTVEQEVFALNPQLHFGILIGRGLKNSGSTPEDSGRLRSAEEHVRQIIKAEDLRSHPIVKGYRDTMEKAGINPNKYPPSTEAMLKRVLKGASLPEINALVDLCNAVSIENQISLGGHDLRDVHEDLAVRFTEGTERFLPFGAEEYEAVEAEELVFTSGDIVQTRKWIWRQSELGKMTLDTQDVFFQLVGFGDQVGSQLIKALDSLEELIVKRFGGQSRRFIVKQSSSEIEF
ncbi:MAG TPA: phenylalanine--tRNA ligase beta subunit-related protein [Clostridia bacterium]|nr:phenylalanine--tRNA ligase beta subunit-related protein [Clostridia bacterium]